MARYRYRAMNAAGRKLSGQISAVNETDLYFQLKQIGLDLVDASEIRENRFLTILARPIRTRDLIELCIHLEQLEKVGVPILDSLSDIRDSTESPRMRDVLNDVCRDVGNGKLLSEAFALHPTIFNQVFVGLIAAGEQTGNMSESFGHLVHHLKWNDEISKKIKKAVRYPLFLMVTMFVMMLSMMFFLVPQLTSFLSTIGLELPLSTRILIKASDFVQGYWWMVASFPLLVFVAAKLIYRFSAPAAYLFDHYMYRIPMIGPTARKIALSRFSHFFSIMFQSGIGVLQCLETSSQVVANRSLATSLEIVRKMVEGGNSLTNAMKSSGEFPELILRMIRIGEETGNLGESLGNISYFYDRDVNEAVDNMVASIQPLLTVVVGAVMIWIIISVLGPVYNSFAQLPI